VRSCLAISAIIHAALLLWVALGPGSKPFGPAYAEPIMVDLVLPQEVARDPFKLDLPTFELPKPDLPKPELRKPDPLNPELSKPIEARPEQQARLDAPKPAQRPPAPAKPAPQADPKQAAASQSQPPTADDLKEQAATAARVAWMLDLPSAASTNLAAPPSELKSNLSGEEVAELKARVSKCFTPPAGVEDAPGLEILMRLALKPNGTLAVEPALIRAPALLSGPPLVESAKRALRQCQPYSSLPADKYKDWKVLDLTFTLAGPSGVGGRSTR
jgi:hypothetical protein